MPSDPLSSPEAERAVLGALLVDPSLIPEARASLASGHFLDPRNRAAWEALCTVSDACQEPDVRTLEPLLRRSHPAEEWLPYLTALDLDLPEIDRLRNYVDLLHDLYCRRRIRAFGLRVQKEAVTHQGHGSELFGKCVQCLATMDVGANGSLGPDLRDTLAEVRQFLRSPSDARLRARTGLLEIDQALNGLQPGNLIVLAGRPGMGKSRMALLWAYATARTGGKVAFRSLEMARRELVLSICSQQTRVPFEGLQRRTLTPPLAALADHFLDDLGEMPLYIADQGRADRAGIISWAKRLHAGGHLDLLVVDYLQLVGGQERDRRWQVGAATREFKLLAGELQMPVVLLSQLSRPGERRRGTDFRPQLWDLKEAGEIENDADVVVFLHRQHYYDAEASEADAEAIIAKHRNGWTGTLSLGWDGQAVRFYGRKGA